MKTCPECYSEYEDELDVCPADQTQLTQIERDPLLGTRLAERYEIVSVIGRGGMGVVYKARQELMDKFMAIKMLHQHMVSETESVKRFFREAKTVSQVKHHNIVTLYDFGMSPLGQPYLVMDYLDGDTLKKILKEEGPLSFDRVAKVFRQACDGLSTAHSMDVVHRDLKPENIVLSKNNGEDDWVTLVDFGLSKLKDPKAQEGYTITKVGDVCGSPPYMSPEQCLSASHVDPRSDIYSLAVVVYESLSGKLPYSAKSAIEMMDAHLYGTPIPLSQSTPELKVCTEISHVLNKALEKDPANRQQSIAEFGQELQDAIPRDSLKLRTHKHRMEVAGYKDLASAAEAYPSDSPGLEGVQFVDRKKAVPNQAGIETLESHTLQGLQSPINRSGETPAPTKKKEAEPTGWMGKFKTLLGGKEKNGKHTEIDSEATYKQDYKLDNCPYCGAPIKSSIRFCVNCQRQMPSPREVARLRVSQGKFNLPKSKTGQQDTGRMSSLRTGKASGAAGVMSFVQRALLVVLLALIVYGCARAANDPTVIKTLRRVVDAVQKPN